MWQTVTFYKRRIPFKLTTVDLIDIHSNHWTSANIANISALILDEALHIGVQHRKRWVIVNLCLKRLSVFHRRSELESAFSHRWWGRETNCQTELLLYHVVRLLYVDIASLLTQQEMTRYVTNTGDRSQVKRTICHKKFHFDSQTGTLPSQRNSDVFAGSFNIPTPVNGKFFQSANICSGSKLTIGFSGAKVIASFSMREWENRTITIFYYFP
jgi:hypothetical protein